MHTVPQTPWLYPEERAGVIGQMLEWGLLKFDNGRGLPVKSGGLTDVYVNERDARDNSEAIDYLARLYESPLRQLGVSRFVEVPDSVSCFAGPLSMLTGLPYLTIREQAKEGRVTKAKVIGHPSSGDEVVIMDDVITDGASKIAPYTECLEMGLNVKAP
ncbi:MAG: hypothetical protein CMI53_00700 [Parcubacteria group bacterium]|jgi:orotate phosphoribosyltransferase|nr:hypothetical protein [Parcubacteria group bacterium]|tara:strand:- start:7244 stop:7720 length:477 start_codon:yes stop_codon:yes gene_type:complete